MSISSYIPQGSRDHELRDCLDAEIEEIMKYKWYLGEKLRHDPLLDRSMNEICQEWIDKYAREFRKTWENSGIDTNRCDSHSSPQ